MPAIPFPASSSPGKVPAEGKGRLKNVYASGEGVKQCPGLAQFMVSTRSGFRGAIEVGALTYAAFEDKAVKIDASGAETVLSGTLSGTKPVTWALNNKKPTPDLVCVDPDNGCFTVTSSAVSSFADPDLDPPNSVAFVDGFFIWTMSSGKMMSSGLNAITVDALDFATCESAPDALLTGAVYGGLFYAFGAESTEIWQNAANAEFPLSRVHADKIGALGATCVAGHESGWSDGLFVIANDGTVRLWSGYQSKVVSTPAVERFIRGVADTATIRMGCYVVGELAVVTISAPEGTWEYNARGGRWHERNSNGLARWRGEMPFKFAGEWYCGDSENSTIWRITDDVLREGAADVPYLIESPPVDAFPVSAPVFRADFNLTVGQGIANGLAPIQTDPRIFVSWSDDGGNNWSMPVMRKLGGQGRYNARVTVAPVGMSGHVGRRWRLSWSDPVHTTLVSAAFNEKPFV